MIEIACPECSHTMKLNTVKSGKFKPTCKKCKKPFLLQIDANLKATTARIPISAAAPSAQPKIEDDLEQTAPSQFEVPQEVNETAPSQFPTSNEVEQTAPSEISIKENRAAGTNAKINETMPSASGQSDDFSLVLKQKAEAGAPQEQTMPSAGQGGTQADVSAISQPVGMPARLGGYAILGELGRGAMGAVYQAKQLSLNRLVALKTIQAKWLQNPIMLARFTREAFAAAQLVHHNVVQIYDLGSENKTTFFSMEYVKGENLADLVKRRGKVDPEIAASHILQAARGLQFAHNQGMVHRDVKPANLLINEQSVVKVADLGLVKVPQDDDFADSFDESNENAVASGSSSNLTMVRHAMGTAAFMAPEQAEDASSVDHRADIYSLGCTFYVLLTGKPPFQGTSALEVISKHKTEPIVRPEAIVNRVPEALSNIVLKMVGKKPESRYANMGEVIAELESFLGVKDAKGFTPSDEDAAKILAYANEFNNSGTAKMRGLLAGGFVGGTILLALVTALFQPWIAISLVALMLGSVMSYFIVSGIRDRTHLFGQTCEFVFGSRLTDWMMWIGGGLLALILVYFSGSFLPVVVASLVGVGIGVGFHFLFDGKLSSERANSIAQTESLLMNARVQGENEENIRLFVAKYCGSDWEEFFESLFGYDAKIATRELMERGESGRRRKRFRPWKDWLINSMSRRLGALKEERQLNHLQKVEQAGLQAQGVSADEAREQADSIARALIQQNQELKDQLQEKLAVADPEVARQRKREKIKAMLEEARNSEPRSRSIFEVLNLPLNLFAGPHVRFLLGCLLLAGCLMWMNQNGLLSKAKAAIDSSNVQDIANQLEDTATDTAGWEPLSFPFVGRYFTNFNPGVAGLMLVFAGVFGGWRMSLFLIPAAAIMVLLPPALMNYGELIAIYGSMAGGVTMGVIGLMFGRLREDEY